MWIPYAFWPTFISVVINLSLIVYIIRANIKKPGNMAAFIMFLSILIWSIGELIERIAGPPPHDKVIAYFGVRFLFIGTALLSASLIHFLLDYPYRIRIRNDYRKGIIYGVYAFSVLGIIIDIFNDFLGKIVIAGEDPYSALGQTIWGLTPGPVHKLYVTWLLITAFLLLIGLLLKIRNVKMRIVRMQIWFTFAGMVIAYALITLTGYVPIILGIEMYPLTTISFSILGLFIIYTIYRYRLFLVVPTSETVEMQEKLPKAGFYELAREEAFKKFANLARSGYKSLAFVSENVDKFKEKYGLKATPVFEIAKQPGKDRLNPEIDEQREMIPFIISTFMEEVNNPVVLIDLTAKHITDELRKKIMDEIKRECGERGVFLVAS